jgi:NUMOD3 motif
MTKNTSKDTQFKKGYTPWNKGLTGAYTRSEETKRKISEGNKGRIPWLKGKHHTEQARAKISASLIGNKRSNAGENNGMFGKHQTEESKLKISNSMKLSWKERIRNPKLRGGEY